MMRRMPSEKARRYQLARPPPNGQATRVSAFWNFFVSSGGTLDRCRVFWGLRPRINAATSITTTNARTAASSTSTTQGHQARRVQMRPARRPQAALTGARDLAVAAGLAVAGLRQSGSRLDQKMMEPP